MKHVYNVTLKWYVTKENPENKVNNGYDFIEVRKTYKVTINDKYDELTERHLKFDAIQKALVKGEKDSGYKLSSARHLDEVIKIKVTD